MTMTVANYPITAVLVAAESILGPNAMWAPQSPAQTRFLTNGFWATCMDLAHLPEIQSLAAYTADEINDFLASKGYSIKLNPWPVGTGFGAASTMDVKEEWSTPGDVVTIRTLLGTFPAVRIKKDGFSILASEGHPNPLIALNTVSGDTVYITMGDAPTSPEALEAKVMDLFERRGPTPSRFGGVVFPMVSLDQTTELSWLKGMIGRGDRDEATITQAIQQTKFKMNEKGARAQSAVAIGMTRSMAPPDHTIDKPFLVWILRTGVHRPIIAAHVTQESWVNPGSL